MIIAYIIIFLSAFNYDYWTRLAFYFYLMISILSFLSLCLKLRFNENVEFYDISWLAWMGLLLFYISMMAILYNEYKCFFTAYFLYLV